MSATANWAERLSVEELRKLPDDELSKLRDYLEQAVSAIKNQLATARANVHAKAEYSDPVWFSRTEAAGRIKATRMNLVCRLLAERRRAKGHAMHSNDVAVIDDKRRLFVKVAERMLKPETFQAIWDEVNAEMEGAREARS